MATSVVCDNAAVRGFELLKLSGNAEIDGERERPMEGRLCARNENTHCHIPTARNMEVHDFPNHVILLFDSISKYREKSCS